MKKILIILLSLLFLGGIALAIFYFFPKKKTLAALQVISTPKATIFLDGRHLGKTPFLDDKIAAGEYSLKLIPMAEATVSSSWQTKIKLTPGVLTYIERIFGLGDIDSAGEILTLEPLKNKTEVEVAVLSTPDGATIKLDGQFQGVTPLILKDVTASDHEMILSLSGFKEQSFRFKSVLGFKLTASVQLAKVGEEKVEEPVASPSAVLVPEGPTGARVKILETPTGWLRVRLEPSLAATEAAKVKPQEIYPLLEEKSGWFKIRYSEGKEGWVSGQYSQKVE